MMGGSAPQTPRDLALFFSRMDGFCFSGLRSCRTLERLDRKTGQRRDATRAPIQARNGWRPSGRLLVTPPHHLSDCPILSNLWGPPQGVFVSGKAVVVTTALYLTTFFSESIFPTHNILVAAILCDEFRGQYEAGKVGKEVHSRSGKDLPGKAAEIASKWYSFGPGLSYRQIDRQMRTVRRVLGYR